jgi:bifunctional non-homologous end joining protein LigD
MVFIPPLLQPFMEQRDADPVILPRYTYSVSPSDITLMHPTLIGRRFHREGWVYEEKYDGWRILALKSESKVQLLSRNGRDHARRFGELAKVIAALPEDTVILDGEVAIFDEHLISRFEWLRHGARESLATPPIYMAFDVLQVGRQDIRQEPLRTRRKVLEGLLDGQRLLLPARRLSGSGVEAWREVQERGYEGFVAKDGSSLYIGGRTLSWLKIKVPDYRAENRGWSR